MHLEQQTPDSTYRPPPANISPLRGDRRYIESKKDGVIIERSVTNVMNKLEAMGRTLRRADP